jgi:hypothetical protein
MEGGVLLCPWCDGRAPLIAGSDEDRAHRRRLAQALATREQTARELGTWRELFATKDPLSKVEDILNRNALSAIANIITLATSKERERCASLCEAMVIGGRAWDHDQAVAAETLFAAAKAIRGVP